MLKIEKLKKIEYQYFMKILEGNLSELNLNTREKRKRPLLFSLDEKDPYKKKDKNMMSLSIFLGKMVRRAYN